MRKSINGLSGIVQNEIKLNSYDPSLFGFSKRKKDQVKILYWDRNGFCLWQKRLERDKFPWPQNELEVMEITAEQLGWLLNGIDFQKPMKLCDTQKSGKCLQYFPGEIFFPCVHLSEKSSG